MSSGTRVDPYAARNINENVGGQFLERNQTLGLSPRQLRLNYLMARYSCSLYDTRKFDWDGGEHADPLAAEAIGQAGFLPPGYYDAGQTLPIKFRRPSTPYFLDKVVVDRFTSLLFSERRHPRLALPDNPEGETQLQELAKKSRLWPAFMKARTLGGAMGTAIVGFQFQKGAPRVEVLDPRWVVPDFVDRATRELRAIEIRYQFPKEKRDPETKAWITEAWWYRRVIDETSDTLFAPAPVGDGDEPEWKVQRSVDHNFGFCPYVWIQNVELLDDVDGEHDCHGMMELSDEIDKHLSQASVGIASNCDPTLLLFTDAKLAEVKKGSANAIKLEKGAAVSYLEMNGSGPKTAIDFANRLRELALEVAQCVLDNPNTASAKTATEIERNYASMLSKADMLREQYGERGIKILVQMMIRAARGLGKPRIVQGTVTRMQTAIDVSKIPDGEENDLELRWGPYFEPSAQDAVTATQAASAAKSAGLIDDEHATKFVAGNFRVEDVPGMIEKIQESQGGYMGSTPFGGEAVPPGFEPPPEPGATQ